MKFYLLLDYIFFPGFFCYWKISSNISIPIIHESDTCILTSVIIEYSVELVETRDGSQSAGRRSGPAQYSVPVHFAFQPILFPVLILMLTFETLELFAAKRLVQFVNVVQYVQHIIAVDQRFCGVCREPGHIWCPPQSPGPILSRYFFHEDPFLNSGREINLKRKRGEIPFIFSNAFIMATWLENKFTEKTLDVSLYFYLYVYLFIYAYWVYFITAFLLY